MRPLPSPPCPALPCLAAIPPAERWPAQWARPGYRWRLGLALLLLLLLPALPAFYHYIRARPGRLLPDPLGALLPVRDVSAPTFTLIYGSIWPRCGWCCPGRCACCGRCGPTTSCSCSGCSRSGCCPSTRPGRGAAARPRGGPPVSGGRAAHRARPVLPATRPPWCCWLWLVRGRRLRGAMLRVATLAVAHAGAGAARALHLRRAGRARSSPGWPTGWRGALLQLYCLEIGAGPRLAVERIRL
ncbi:MAG: hypothetical protein WKG07_30810 [Hymenobacter sp.]